MSWLPILLGSSVIVALVKVIEALATRWRPQAQIEDDRSARTFDEMHRVAGAYKEAFNQVRIQLDQTLIDVSVLRVQVRELEHELELAGQTIMRLRAGSDDLEEKSKRRW